MKNLQSMIIGLLGAILGAFVIYLAVPQTVRVSIARDRTVAISHDPVIQPTTRSSADRAENSGAAVTVPAATLPPSTTQVAPEEPINSGVRSKGGNVVTLPQGAPPKEDGPPRPYKDVYVLSVGVNRYPGTARDEQLKFATNDAAQLMSTLRQKYGFSKGKMLLDEQATRSQILSTLDNIRSQLSTNDDFIFFFSGHGQTMEERRSATNVVRHGFLLPYDRKLTLTNSLAVLQERALNMKELVTQVMALPARHRILLLDSCFSGLAFVNQQASVEPPSEIYREIISRPTVQILTAGLEGESTLEFDEISHGLFSHALLEQLGSVKVRSVDEVFLPLRVEVRDYLARKPGRGRMTPQHRYLQFQSGTFVFVPTDRLASWADQGPGDPTLADARRKGYYRPVEAAEVASVTNKADSAELRQNKEWQATIERYEVRAAMGDPYAQMALADIYRRGVGMNADQERSQMWAKEGSDAVFAGLFNIKDPFTAKLVDGILLSALQDQNTAGQAALAIWIMAMVNQGGGPSVNGIRSLRQEILVDLGRKVPDYRGAKNHLQEWLRKLDELQKDWPKDAAQPSEIEELRRIIQQASGKAEAQLRNSASNLVNSSEALIQRIEAQIPKKQNKQ